MFLRKLLLMAACVLIAQNAYASDLAKANALRKRCEKEASVIKIAVTNFGDQTDKANYVKGVKLIKIGKAKLARSKFVDAQKKYMEYLLLQKKIYKSLAKKYLKRTDNLIDEITSELVDHIDNKKVDKYFKLAARNHNSGKQSMTRNHFTQVIEDCRTAKKYVISCYKLVNLPMPAKYAVDWRDINYQTK